MEIKTFTWNYLKSSEHILNVLLCQVHVRENPSDLIEYHTSQGPNYNFAAFSKGTIWECMCTCESKRVSRLCVGVCLYVFVKGVWD